MEEPQGPRGPFIGETFQIMGLHNPLLNLIRKGLETLLSRMFSKGLRFKGK